MTSPRFTSFHIATLTAILCLVSTASLAHHRPGHNGGPGGDDTCTENCEPITSDPDYYAYWMHSEIEGAWGGGYLGQGVTITVVDDFNSPYDYWGNLENSLDLLRHGEWTLLQAGLIAPSATMVADEFSRGGGVRLASGFNVLNLSYGIYAATGYNVDQLLFGRQEASIISYAENGDAVISKAAGNDATAVGTGNSDGLEDYLATALIGTQSAIFVGALDYNGTVLEGVGTGTLAYYSNYAGSDTAVQEQFLVVGVASGLSRDVDGDGNYIYSWAVGGTGLAGTSFAAPIISGYAAILSSKFSGASPTQVASQLLSTAREDTIFGYDIEIHGQGEASIFRALAPGSIDGFGEYPPLVVNV